MTPQPQYSGTITKPYITGVSTPYPFSNSSSNDSRATIVVIPAWAIVIIVLVSIFFVLSCIACAVRKRGKDRRTAHGPSNLNTNHNNGVVELYGAPPAYTRGGVSGHGGGHGGGHGDGHGGGHDGGDGGGGGGGGGGGD